jgi:hypothetical protein
VEVFRVWASTRSPVAKAPSLLNVNLEHTPFGPQRRDSLDLDLGKVPRQLRSRRLWRHQSREPLPGT